MKEDFILAEDEMSIAVNKMTNMLDFLSRSIDSYTNILSKVQQNGIKDQRICEELSGLAERVKKSQESIEKIYKELDAVIRSGIEDVEANDNFEFPDDFMTEVVSILSMFF